MSVRCDQDASIALGGKLTIRTRSRHGMRITSVSLARTRGSVRAGKATTERLKLSTSALRELERGARVSAILTLTASNVHGTNRASAGVLHLRRA